MITVPRCFRAAGAVMILASVSLAGDTPGINTYPDRVLVAASYEARPSQRPGGLEARRPYERGKVPVVLIHGLWGNPRL